MSAPLEGRWIAKPRRPHSVVPYAVSTFYAALLPSFVLLMTNGRAADWAIGLYLAFTVGVLLASFSFLIRRYKTRHLLVAELMADDEFGAQFPVEVTVFAKGKPLGRDQGVVWFADDLMGFSGAACSFVLASTDLMWGLRPARAGGQVQTWAKGVLLLRGAPVDAFLVLTPLGGNILGCKKRVLGFVPSGGGTEDERLARYMGVDSSPSEERCWPPLKPYAPPERLGDRLEDVAPLQHAVDRRALRVGERNER